MTLDEALGQCVEGQRITASHMQPGCYVEHSFSRGFLRCWPVDRVEDEPQRTQCDFITKPEDMAADWRIIADGEQYPKPVKLTGGWGATPSQGVNVASRPGKLTVTTLPIADVIDLSAPVAPAPPVWAPRVDPLKGGW